MTDQADILQPFELAQNSSPNFGNIIERIDEEEGAGADAGGSAPDVQDSAPNFGNLTETTGVGEATPPAPPVTAPVEAAPPATSTVELSGPVQIDISNVSLTDLIGLGDAIWLGLIFFVALVAARLVSNRAQEISDRTVAFVRGITFVQRNGVALSLYLVGGVTFWILFMIILPQLYMLDFSFRYDLPPDQYGSAQDVWTLSNYEYLIFGRENNPDGFNKLHLLVFIRTMGAAVCITLFNFAFCYPLAFYLAQMSKGSTTRLLVICLVIPFWVNEILRAFAFRIIFGTSGIINIFLQWLGITDAPIDFVKADVALYAGLTYAYILLMVFPLYNAIESLDHNQIEAGRDLGSPWWRIHWRIVIPHAKPGIASGCTMVFMLCAGALAAPKILGGPSSYWFTQIIDNWFFEGLNWPRGSAYAFVLLLACLIFVLLVMKLFKVKLGEIAAR